MTEQILAITTLISTLVTPASASARVLLSPIPEHLLIFNQNEKVLAEHSLDLTVREVTPKANQGFADNILLALHYLKGDVQLPVDWEAVRQPFEVSFVLQPGEIFAFHNNVLAEYQNPKVTMNSRFFIDEGYQSVWGLGGNGVCHLASLMNWVASEVGLEVVAKANHNFALIPGVAKKYGTSIRSQSANQNLYLINNFDFPIVFKFEINQEIINLKVLID